MSSGPLNQAMRQLRRALLAGDDGRPDAQLLERFVALRDESAFAALVRRHGPMVLGVCRRTAGHADDADDAFQAVFLVLARKAASIRAPARLGAWLYGVAYRTARKARAAADRLRGRERQVATMPQPAVEPEDRWHEVAPLLDQELSRLPEKYRVPIVLCDLEGGPRKEVARRLGVPEGTLSSRLATGRRMLARRLGRFGLAVSGGALAAVLARRACAAVPAALSAAAVRGVLVSATAAVAVSAKVAALAEGAIKAMLWTKLKITAVAVLAAGLLFAGAGAAALGPGTAGAAEPAKADPSKPAADATPKPAEGAYKQDGWALDFRFKELRSIQVDVPGAGKKLVWYLVYSVANPTDQEHSFIPDFELAVAGQEGHPDKTFSAVVQHTIEQAEDPDGAAGRVQFKKSVTMAADPLPPAQPDMAAKPTAGLATWDEVDADGDRFTLYVGGLTNAWAADEKGQVRRKTLRLDFTRDGGQMRLAGEPHWVYRPSQVPPPGPPDPTEELRRTVADLHRELERTRYAATFNDAEIALLQKDQEIAVLRDKLTAAQIQVEALTDRCKLLEQRIREMEKQKDPDKGKKDDAPAADVPHIEGVVTKTDGNLVVISIGKDSGVAAGMSLDVYRLDPPTYLGSLKIIEARDKDAVGKPAGPTSGKEIKAGDHVSNSILGK